MANAFDARAHLTSHTSSVSSAMGPPIIPMQMGNASSAAERKSKNMTLRLDSMGREVDDYGNVVKMTSIKSTIANVAIEKEAKKKDNPYLAHRAPKLAAGVPGIPVSGSASVAPPGFASVLPPSVPGVVLVDPSAPEPPLDDRLIITNRNSRGKRALHFVEAGKYVQKEESFRLKEERKIVAGYASGRKAPELVQDNDQNSATADAGGGDNDSMDIAASAESISMAPSRAEAWGGGGAMVPVIEWWDEAFLPKDLRETLKRSAATTRTAQSSSTSSSSSGNSFTAAKMMTTEEYYAKVALGNVKTHIYIQHPPSIRALGGDRPEVPLPMYLTKKERKRIRKTAREERERDKRDKLMMGLIPMPEPKFKLSNFMKLLGDQAIADPSKVELRVLQQMRQRELTHEMRNLSRKLTPAERKAKKMKKLQEDTSRQVHVALFRVEDFSDPKHRFKVDVNAQQYFLSGTVVLCQEPDDGESRRGFSVVVVEGGPKGLKKFIRLMLKRIAWDTKVEARTAQGGWDEEEEDEEDDDEDEDDEDDEDDEGAAPAASKATAASTNGNGNGSSSASANSNRNIDASAPVAAASSSSHNQCHLVWQGTLAKRTFTGFKFQECRSFATARKLLESRSVQHYWDMCAQIGEGR